MLFLSPRTISEFIAWVQTNLGEPSGQIDGNIHDYCIYESQPSILIWLFMNPLCFYVYFGMLTTCWWIFMIQSMHRVFKFIFLSIEQLITLIALSNQFRLLDFKRLGIDGLSLWNGKLILWSATSNCFSCLSLNHFVIKYLCDSIV